MNSAEEQIGPAYTFSPDWKRQYINVFEIDACLSDFKISGGISSVIEGRLNIEMEQQIITSPQQAVLLRNLLSLKIEQYEKAFGPIPYVRAAQPESTRSLEGPPQ